MVVVEYGGGEGVARTCLHCCHLQDRLRSPDPHFLDTHRLSVAEWQAALGRSIRAGWWGSRRRRVLGTSVAARRSSCGGTVQWKRP